MISPHLLSHSKSFIQQNIEDIFWVLVLLCKKVIINSLSLIFLIYDGFTSKVAAIMTEKTWSVVSQTIVNLC